MNLRVIRHFLCLSSFVVTLVACSSSPEKGTVSGKVTLDGQPLKSGLIRFVPVDGLTPTSDTTIVEGNFTASVPPGEKRVEITAPKVVGTKKLYDTPDSPTVDIVEELLPPRYNVASTLTLDIAAGEQSKDFALESAAQR
jgi:hypothetical protein